MPKPTFESDFHRVLFDHVHNCTVDEFKTVLAKYGQDSACLKVMQDAIRARLGIEDSGDWTSRASCGWQPTRDKQKALDRHILDRGPANAFETAARKPAQTTAIHPAADTSDIAALRAEVAVLKQRIQKLETGRKSRDLRL